MIDFGMTQFSIPSDNLLSTVLSVPQRDEEEEMMIPHHPSNGKGTFVSVGFPCKLLACA